MVRLKYDPSRMDELKTLLRPRMEQEGIGPIGLERFVAGPEAVFELPSLLEVVAGSRVRQTLLVCDETPILREGVLLRDLLSALLRRQGLAVETLLLPGDATGLLHADMDAVSRTLDRLHPGSGVVAVGAGTVTDVAKYAVHLAGEGTSRAGSPPLVVCQTATSVSAFGSNQSVILKDGVKRTLPAVYPDAVVADMKVLRGAPRQLNLGGYGDVMALLISSLDWEMSRRFGMIDRHSPLAADLLQDVCAVGLSIGEAVGRMDEQGLEALAKVLLVMGIVSSLGFGTAPISGFEHAVSHALDLEGLALGRRLAIHGAQVGVAVAYAAVAYRLWLDAFSPSPGEPGRVPSDEEGFREINERISAIDREGKTGLELWGHYREKLARWRGCASRTREILSRWNEPGGVRETALARLPNPSKVVGLLRLSGNPVLPEELDSPVSGAEMKRAFLNGRFMRDRFSLVDLPGFAGEWDEPLWQRVDIEVRRLAGRASS
jgi:glycerol-1-phosphate dehydrogenase [NAD(P)+]